MSNDTLHIPVRATMSRQPDGSYRMTDAEYADIPAAVVAKWLIDRLGAPVEGGQAPEC